MNFNVLDEIPALKHSFSESFFLSYSLGAEGYVI